MGENLKISIFFRIPPKISIFFSPPPPPQVTTSCKFFLKNNTYIKHEKSHYLLAVIYSSVIKLPYYFVKNCL